MVDEQKQRTARDGPERATLQKAFARLGTMFRWHDRRSNKSIDGPSRSSRVLRQIALFGSGVGLVLLGVVLLLQTDWGTNRIRLMVTGRLNDMLTEATVEIGRLDGNILSTMTVNDVRLHGEDGSVLIHVESVTARYRLLPLIVGAV